MERGGRGARRDVRPPPHRARATDRRLDPGVGAHAQPHAAQPLQQRRHRPAARRKPLRLHGHDARAATAGCSSSVLTPAQWDALAASPDAGDLADPRIATAAARAENMELAAAALLRRGANSTTRPTSFASWRRSGARSVRTRHRRTCSRRTQLAHREFFREVDDGRGGRVLVPGPPYRCSVTPVEIRSAPTLGRGTGFARRTRRQASAAARPRTRGRADPRLHLGRRGPVRNVPARAAGRRSGQGRVHETPRPGPTGLPHRLRRDQPLTELQRAQPRQAVVPGRPLRTRGACARAPARGVGRRRRRQLPPGRHDEVRARCRDAPRPAAGAHRRVLVGERRHRPGRDGGRSRQHLRRDRRAVRADRLRRRSTDGDRRVDRLPEREARWQSACSPRCCTGRARARASTSTWRRGKWSRPARPMRCSPSSSGLRGRSGSATRHREFAPHDVYPAAGEDDWVAVAVGDESEWAGLCARARARRLVPRYPTADARSAASAEIDDAIGAWTRQRSSREAFEVLQAAGVPAMAVMTNESLATDPHLAARRVFVDIDHPELGRTRVMRQPWLFSDLDVEIRHGPLMGQDNDYVLDTILGLSTSERADVGGGAPMTVEGSDVRIGIVGGGDAPDRCASSRRGPSTRCGPAATSRRAIRAPRPWSGSCGSPRSPSGSRWARRSCCFRSIRRHSSPSRSPISIAPPTVG